LISNYKEREEEDIMRDYSKELPAHRESYVGENDLFLEIYEGEGQYEGNDQYAGEVQYEREGHRKREEQYERVSQHEEEAQYVGDNRYKREERQVEKGTILFVHGAYTGSWMWSKYIPYFVREGRRCYVMNLRGHYKSRGMDLSRVTFEDYLKDVEEVIAEIGETPVVIGFSMGGILCQKLAEKLTYAGLVLIDSSICREVNRIAPYEAPAEPDLGLIVPAPEREESVSIDESEEDIAFQRKYLSIESAKAFYECGCWIRGVEGIPVNPERIRCPVLVIRAENNEEERRRGEAEAGYFGAEYAGFENATHTGLLVGQQVTKVIRRIEGWLCRKG
jgi:pimeloyl-ACP methyl ester carboxylesterase